jgi:hypothetical protein
MEICEDSAISVVFADLADRMICGHFLDFDGYSYSSGVPKAD